MIQGGDYLLKENEELASENDHKMIILLTFYPVKVGSPIHVVCFRSTGYYMHKGRPRWRELFWADLDKFPSMLYFGTR